MQPRKTGYNASPRERKPASPEDSEAANSAYDKAFHEEMKGLRPDWFVPQTQGATQKKRELIRIARNNEPRPSHDRTLRNLENRSRRPATPEDEQAAESILRTHHEGDYINGCVILPKGHGQVTPTAGISIRF